MSQTIYEFLESMCIGRVEFVSPDEIKVLLDVEAPDSVAMNAGSPRPFPRVHGYVLIPNDDGYIVGQIEWITVERSAFPKRKGVQDFGVVDLPFPLRRMSLNPLGTLRTIESQSSLSRQSYEEAMQTLLPSMKYEFHRGAEMLPTIGDQVLIPSELQLKSIVQSGQQTRLRIGASPLASDADVFVDPDRLFGRHLAVLGNTGSGKSCSVAGLIHWSLEAAASQLSASPNVNPTMVEGAESPTRDSAPPNARFIILDPNGEYAHAFSSDKSLSKARVFRVNPDIDKGEKPLSVPIWFWNSAEWCAIAQASSRTQRPALIQALRQVRDGLLDSPGDREHQIRRFLRTMVATLHLEKNSGAPWGSFPKPKSFYHKIDRWKSGINPELSWFSGEKEHALKRLVDYIEQLCVSRRVAHPESYDFTRQEIEVRWSSRSAPCDAPPSQNRACAIYAHGSS